MLLVLCKLTAKHGHFSQVTLNYVIKETLLLRITRTKSCWHRSGERGVDDVAGHPTLKKRRLDFTGWVFSKATLLSHPQFLHPGKLITFLVFFIYCIS
jgi:hypothetical protein